MNESSVSSVLDLAERIATEVFGGPIAVAFDEFQEIERLRRICRWRAYSGAAYRRISTYLQELSSQVFDAVVAAGRDWVEDADIDAGIAGQMSENTDYYVEKLSTLSGMQRLLVASSKTLA